MRVEPLISHTLAVCEVSPIYPMTCDGPSALLGVIFDWSAG